MVLKSINPSNKEVLKEFKENSQTELDDQLRKSTDAFDHWKNATFEKKSKLLKNVGKILRKNKSQYARLMTLEMGKPIAQAESEVEKCAWVCDFYAENGRKFLEKEIIKTDADSSFIQYNPLGVILGIMPWNFPFWQVFRFAVPSLIAGNTVLLKHSSNVPQCARAIEDIFKTAGFENNEFQTLLIRSKKMSTIVEDDRIAAVSLTGSTVAGMKTAEKTGKNIKKTVLELGGSDPFIVLDDVDLNHTVDMAVKARMINNGQSCIAAKRFIVLESIFDKFVKVLTKKISNLTVGDPFDRDSDIGPLATQDIVDQLDRQVKKSVEMGGEVLIGGEKPDMSGFYYLPTIITNIKKGMPVYNEETFGPVAAIIKVKDDQEAVNIANNTCYGLGASIWTNDIKKAERLSKYIEAGNVFVNEVVKSDPRLPFGGIKKSGFGRELSSYGLKEFVNIQTIYIKRPKRV
jgi:succinate-semialdehyde dehydrogenase/glutarate-semialdehyde dehydrogenase